MRSGRPAATRVAAVVAVAAAGLGACAADQAGSGTPSGGGTTIDITVKDGTVHPNGAQLDAVVDRPITLRIDADTAGEIHVHSTPEQELEFGKGRTQLEITLNQAGQVDIEEHESDSLIARVLVK